MMSTIVMAVLIVVVALVGLGVGIELFRIIQAVRQRNWARVRHFGYLSLQHGLFLASFLLLLETRHASNAPIYLMIAALFLRMVGSWPLLKPYISEEPRQGAA